MLMWFSSSLFQINTSQYHSCLMVSPWLTLYAEQGSRYSRLEAAEVPHSAAYTHTQTSCPSWGSWRVSMATLEFNPVRLSPLCIACHVPVADSLCLFLLSLSHSLTLSRNGWEHSLPNHPYTRFLRSTKATYILVPMDPLPLSVNCTTN